MTERETGPDLSNVARYKSRPPRRFSTRSSFGSSRRGMSARQSALLLRSFAIVAVIAVGALGAFHLKEMGRLDSMLASFAVSRCRRAVSVILDLQSAMPEREPIALLTATPSGIRAKRSGSPISIRLNSAHRVARARGSSARPRSAGCIPCSMQAAFPSSPAGATRTSMDASSVPSRARAARSATCLSRRGSPGAGRDRGAAGATDASAG